MAKSRRNKSSSYRELIKRVAKSSGYYEYEVEDVLDHLIGNIQVLLLNEVPVKLSGLGTISISKINVTNQYADGELKYTTQRLSLSMDDPMRRYLKENMNAKQPKSDSN